MGSLHGLSSFVPKSMSGLKDSRDGGNLEVKHFLCAGEKSEEVLYLCQGQQQEMVEMELKTRFPKS